MRKLILTIAAVATFGLAVPTFTSQAQAQHGGVAVQGGGHGGGVWRGGDRGNRPAMMRQGHGGPRMMVAPGMGRHGARARHGAPRMHRRY
ncbi:MAG: hypothetical protein NT113_21475 [Hyphomicrobiales bacterium]|nr:hypothetical protein [Hyphomicrobiales bacterium]